MLSRLRSSNDGSTSIEFALLINIFVVFVIGLIGFMGFLATKAELREAMVEAERYALVHEEQDTDLQSILSGVLASYNQNNLNYQFSRGSTGGRDFVKVDISFDYDLLFTSISVSEARIFPT